MTVEMFVFCSWWFSDQFDIVSETHFSCDTVGRELWLTMLNSLLCPETDRNIRIGKQGYVFILPILRSDVLMFHSWHQSVLRIVHWVYKTAVQLPVAIYYNNIHANTFLGHGTNYSLYLTSTNSNNQVKLDGFSAMQGFTSRQAPMGLYR